MCFIAFLAKINGNCPPGKSPACDIYNWACAWTIFNAIAWWACCYLDIIHLYQGLNGGEKLTNVELMAHIRQSVRDRRI